MRMLLVALIVAVMILGCVQEATVVTLDNKVRDCQCHEEPWTYKPHYQSCLNCHGNEILQKHSGIFAEKGIEARDVKDVNCYDCHEKSLLANHLPKYGCELCHGDPYSIHEKFLKKYEEVSK